MEEYFDQNERSLAIEEIFDDEQTNIDQNIDIRV